MWKHYITLLREQKVAALSSVQAVVTYIVEALSIASIPIILQLFSAVIGIIGGAANYLTKEDTKWKA